ncbi:MAG TPA: helix-turn-helix domain-containing protein, partial [Rhizomicrobium sp.]|nr:helix-turn-helix domain-containing protein [Rhizomicrobium sp.]
MLRRLRTERGISQGRLATKLKMDRAYLSEIENGHRKPTVDLVDKLAEALNAPFHELFLPPEPGAEPPRALPSGRHADLLFVTGPVTKNMREALERAYNATPDPKWVVAVGDCAIDGGLFAGSYAVEGGVNSTVP